MVRSGYSALGDELIKVIKLEPHKAAKL